MATRIETDSMGEVAVPADRYYGAQTVRAIEHFAIGEAMPRELIRAYGVVKKAAARANRALGELPAEIAALIERAADELVAGELDAHFPLRVYQSGSGTQTHMNVNEVLANRANELAGEPLGQKRPVHPNDHVNRGQSTNDTFPTAMHVALDEQLHARLLPALSALSDTLDSKAAAFADLVKIGRTHLQDATPLTLGQEISGWAAQLAAAHGALQGSQASLQQLALGGTAVGTGLNAHPDFAKTAAAEIATLTGRPFVSAENKFAALGGHDACVALSGAQRQLATACLKLANDVRLLACGPRCGLGELQLPANEPGSSIMPGKVNPTQCEALTMACCRVLGNDATVAFAASQGQLQLNTFKPVIVHTLLESGRLLADACESFDHHCARGIEPRRDVIARHLERSLMLVTALAPALGYDKAAAIAKHAHEQDLTLREAAIALGVSESDADALLRPERMLGRAPTAR